MDISVIKSYLVELGFKVDNRQLSQFNEGLKKAASVAGEAIGGISKGFLAAGATIGGVLTSITVGTLGLMNHVANADLDMQLLARRLYISTDAARKMKSATDALGYSIEEIVWGPPELAERYKTLIRDQNQMMKSLGAADFEKQMRNLRDVRFEFTRLRVEMGYFAMFIVKDLSKALFGDENALLQKLQHFSDWFMANMPNIAQEISNKVAPALHNMGEAAAHLWETLSKVDWGTLLKDLADITTVLIKVLDFIVSHPTILKMLLGAAGGAAVGSIIPGVGTGLGAAGGAIFGLGTSAPDLFMGGPKGRTREEINNFEQQHLMRRGALSAVQQQIVAAAIASGVDPSLALAVAKQESGFNPNALNRSSGAMGLFQLMPGTARQLGVTDAFDASQNINAGVRYLHDLIQKHGGDTAAALKDFGGFIKTDPSDYIASVDRYRRQFASGYQPISARTDVGGINVYITQPNATPQDIHGAVVKAVDERLNKHNQMLLAQRQGAYA